MLFPPVWAQNSVAPESVSPSSEIKSRQYLLGDWGGERSALAEKGITFDFFYISDMQANPSGGLQQTVWGIGLSLGGTTGYAINPGRDFGPRIAHALLPIAGKGASDWGYAGIPILGPLVGGALAGVLLRVIG
jgi:hypothetical protein